MFHIHAFFINIHISAEKEECFSLFNSMPPGKKKIKQNMFSLTLLRREVDIACVSVSFEHTSTVEFEILLWVMKQSLCRRSNVCLHTFKKKKSFSKICLKSNFNCKLKSVDFWMEPLGWQHLQNVSSWVFLSSMIKLCGLMEDSLYEEEIQHHSATHYKAQIALFPLQQHQKQQSLRHLMTFLTQNGNYFVCRWQLGYANLLSSLFAVFCEKGLSIHR